MLQVATARSIRCSRCAAPLELENFSDGNWRDCPYCQTPVRMEVFPALATGVALGDPGEHVLTEGEATCFYHAEKRAVVPCDSCGRYLCGLCRLEWGEKNYCPACLESGQTQRKMAQLETSRTMYDSIALTLATVPALLIYPTIITAPISLFLVWRHWKTPLSLVPRTRIRYWLAIAFALLDLAIIGAIVFAVIYAIQVGRSRR